MAREQETKSKLIKQLQMISRGVAPRIGLVPKAEEKVVAMALVVAFDQPAPKLLSAALEAGADALAAAADKGLPVWNDLVEAARQLPLGLTVDKAPVEGEFEKIAAVNPDFIVAQASAAPVSLLDNKSTGRILSLDESYLPHQVRALGQMPVDAVLADVAGSAAAGTLTVRDLLHYRQVVDLVQRPVLVAADERLTPDILPSLRDIGIEGVLLRMAGKVSEEEVRERVTKYRTAIGGLGKSIGRGRERFGALVPHVATRAPVRTEEPEEPDEEPD